MYGSLQSTMASHDQILMILQFRSYVVADEVVPARVRAEAMSLDDVVGSQSSCSVVPRSEPLYQVHVH